MMTAGVGTKTKWKILPHRPEQVIALSRAIKAPPLIAQLLINRGVRTPEDAEVFLQCKLSQLHEPDNLPGANEAAERVVQAIREDKRIVIYGDYDVDGVCGSSVLWACLKLAGAKHIDYYIPKRVDEGYGVNAKALEWLAKERQADMVITVDCGITAVEEAKLARKLGIDLIITDHHTIGPELPDATVLVHPRLPGSAYPFPDLCGAGVAFKLAWQICKGFGDGKRASPHLREFLVDAVNLVAMATVADLVPMKGENRILVYHGLAGIRNKPTAGLRALLEVSGLLDKPSLTTWSIGFGLAPRINAAGRMESAMRAVKMLTTDDPTLALELAQHLNECNSRRQELERQVVAEAREMVEARGQLPDSGAIVVGKLGWHPGVIGIVASRLVDLYQRPSIVVSLGEELGQGSGRSVSKFNLYDAINACSGDLVGFGGHAAAAGVKVLPSRFDDFARRFDDYCRENLTAEQLQRQLLIDDELPLDALTFKMVQWIESLEPHGLGNPRPILMAQNVQVVDDPRFVGEQKTHVQFKVRQENGQIFKAIAFGMAEKLKSMQAGSICKLAFHPSVNVWNNRRNVELEIKDVQFTS